MSEFAATLKAAMAAEQKTLMELGQALGISHSSVARWTTGSLPDDPTLVARCAMTFQGRWPATLVRSYLLDRCPAEWHHLLAGCGRSSDCLSKLEKALEAIRLACPQNPDLRAIVLDLGRLAQGL